MTIVTIIAGMAAATIARFFVLYIVYKRQKLKLGG